MYVGSVSFEIGTLESTWSAAVHWLWWVSDDAFVDIFLDDVIWVTCWTEIIPVPNIYDLDTVFPASSSSQQVRMRNLCYHIVSGRIEKQAVAELMILNKSQRLVEWVQKATTNCEHHPKTLGLKNGWDMMYFTLWQWCWCTSHRHKDNKNKVSHAMHANQMNFALLCVATKKTKLQWGNEGTT